MKPTWTLLALLTAAGCQWTPTRQFEAAQAQARAMADQNRAQLAELENLRQHARKVEDQLIAAEQKLAEVDSARGVDAQRLANYRQERATLRERLSVPAGAMSSAPPPAFQQQLAALAERYPELHFDPDAGVAWIDGQALFDAGQAAVRPDADRMLGELSSLLRSDDARTLRFMIVGHNEALPLQARILQDRYPNAWHLSAAQALSVADRLRREGIPEQQMGLAGFGNVPGYTRLSDGNAAASGRRIELHILPQDAPVLGWTGSATRVR